MLWHRSINKLKTYIREISHTGGYHILKQLTVPRQYREGDENPLYTGCRLRNSISGLFTILRLLLSTLVKKTRLSHRTYSRHIDLCWLQVHREQCCFQECCILIALFMTYFTWWTVTPKTKKKHPAVTVWSTYYITSVQYRLWLARGRIRRTRNLAVDLSRYPVFLMAKSEM